MKKRSIVLVVTVVVIVALAGVVGWLIASGRVAIVWKNSSDRVVTVNSICDDTIIKQYNASFDAGNEKDFISNLNNVASIITKKSNFKQDPTCNYMMFYISLQNRDKENAQSYLDAVSISAKEGHYVNINIKELQDIQAMQGLIDSAGDYKGGGDSGGRG